MGVAGHSSGDLLADRWLNPPRPCCHPGCKALVHARYCEAHQKAFRRKQDESRGNAAERGYDATWRRLRLAFLAQHPICECDDCQAGKLRLTAATVVDHIVSIEERPDLRLDWSNLRAMAKRCHDRRTAKDQAFGRARA